VSAIIRFDAIATGRAGNSAGQSVREAWALPRGRTARVAPARLAASVASHGGEIPALPAIQNSLDASTL
jgi:hypothetical protein